MGQTTGGNPIQNAGNIVKIREIAKMRGLKLNFISQQIGKSNGYLSEISGRNANVPSKYLPAIAEILGTSVEYINGLVDDIDDGLTTSPLDVDYGSFQFDRFYALCQKSGKTQAHLYKMVGMPDKAGSNLRRTKNVKPEILEIWAKELNTSVAYLNGETDDPSPAKSSFRYDRLDDLINKKHLTRKDLCLETGHADNYIRMFEKRGTEPPRAFVNFCAEQLGTTSAYLFGETDDPTAPSAQVVQPEKEKGPAAESHGVTDEDLKFALFGGGDVTDAQFEEVKSFARFVRERDANGQSK
jgi:transcriptional regulator with XRE-family HTH domain